MVNQSAAGPLAGIRVLDFSGFIAGCYGAVLLGDLGAEVTKVEPLIGDGARYWGPFLAGEGRAFQGWNRNKRSIAIDLRHDKGRAIVHALVKESDVVVENFRPGASQKIGMDYETLREINPRLILCSVSAFGQTGPESTRPGYDPMFQAMSGLAKANANFLFAGHECISAVAMSDYGAALLASNGIIAALYHREKTGEGQWVQTSLLQAAMSLQSHYFIRALDTQEQPPFGIYPYRLFETKDSKTFIGGATDKFWEILCGAIERPDLAKDDRYNTNAKRVNEMQQLNEILEPIFRTRTSAEWEELLIPKGLPCASVGSHMEFFDREQVRAMNMKTEVQHSTIGRVEMSGVPIHFSGSSGAVQSAAPRLGEHTREVLNGIGQSNEEIDALFSEGIVK